MSTSSINNTQTEFTEIAAVSTLMAMDYTEGGNSLADLLLLITNLITGSIGLISNMFVVIVIVRFTSMYKQITNLFIINQSVIDALFSLFVITQMSSGFAPQIILFSNEFVSELFCRVWQSQIFLWCAYAASANNLIVLTIERYLKIVHPNVYQSSVTPRRAKILLLLVWLFGFLQVFYAIPTTAIINSTCWTYTVWPDISTRQFTGLMTIVLQYWIPIFVFIFAYTEIIRVFKRVTIQSSIGKLIL